MYIYIYIYTHTRIHLHMISSGGPRGAGPAAPRHGQAHLVQEALPPRHYLPGWLKVVVQTEKYAV